MGFECFEGFEGFGLGFLGADPRTVVTINFLRPPFKLPKPHKLPKPPY